MPNENYNLNLYRIARLSQSSSSFNHNELAHSSPIPAITTSQNRPPKEDFIPPGQKGII